MKTPGLAQIRHPIHRAIYRRGRAAARAGAARKAPYPIETDVDVRHRRLWLAGFDSAHTPDRSPS
jgi:hypothetical protein